VDRRLLAALGGLIMAAGACREGTVVVEPRPAVGDRARYRYEIDATVTRALEGSAPRTSKIESELVVDQRIASIVDDRVEADVTLRRDGAAPRTARVALDRAGAIAGIELVEGLAAADLDLAPLSSLLPPGTAPPRRPLRPGDRWSISDGDQHGRGRLSRLGVVDGEHVAVVDTTVTEGIHDDVAAGASAARLSGTLRSTGTTAYDVDDGAIRRASARSHGQVQATIQPPAGVDAAPVLASITFEIRVRVTRLR
jgi:hypothetical protein